MLRSLQSLLDMVMRQDPDAQLLFAGDYVNRGPDSLESLRFVRALGDNALVVLGNHDLHLLAVAFGSRRAGSIGSVAFAASSAVLVRLPLWPSAMPPPCWAGRYDGCAFSHVHEPVVEYRQ